MKQKHYFIRIKDTLMEVSKEEYLKHYKYIRRQKYLREEAALHGLFSYNTLDNDEIKGEEIIEDISVCVEDEAINAVLVEQLHKYLETLNSQERELINVLFFENKTEREAAKIFGISQVAINKRKNKILSILKKLY